MTQWTVAEDSRREGLIGACCTLGTDELRQRLTEWRGLRDRAESIDRMDEGVRIGLAPEEVVEAIARLVALESACCPFYRFTLEVAGSARRLTIDAGPGGGAAVAALLGL